MKLLNRIYLVFVCLGATGCVPLLPANVIPTPPADRTLVSDEGDAQFYEEEGLKNALWVEVARINGPGVVGGYLSDPADRRALVIILHGASTFDPGATIESAKVYHLIFARYFRDQGYRTWSLALRDCGSAYGQGDLEDALEAVDWLQRGGQATFDVDRVYLVGYSTGGTVATLLNQRRTLTAMVGIGGLAESDQLETLFPLYNFASSLFQANTGLCQLESTLDFYGPPGSQAWDALDAAERVEEFKSPMLFIHGTADMIYDVSNTRSLESHYKEALAADAQLPPLEFFYLDGADHFSVRDDPATIAEIMQFLNRFEPVGDE